MYLRQFSKEDLEKLPYDISIYIFGIRRYIPGKQDAIRADSFSL